MEAENEVTRFPIQSARISILIPTLDRPAFLGRTLSYLAQAPHRDRFTIVVLDGSQAEAAAIKSICDEYSARHLHNPGVSFYDRLALGVKQIETDYALIFGDDDFVDTSVAMGCAEFLDNNPGYVSCAGHYALFRLSPRNPDMITIITSPDQSGRSYDQDEYFERVFWAYVEGAVTLWYGVHRSSTISDVFHRIARATRIRPFDFQIGDPLLMSLLLAHGRVGNLRLPFLFKQIGQSVAREPHLFGGELFLSGRNFTERYAAAKAEILDCLAPDDSAAASTAIDEVWGVFASLCLCPRVTAAKLQQIMPRLNGRFVQATRMSGVIPYPAIGPAADPDSGTMRDYGFALDFIASKNTKVQIAEWHHAEWWGAVNPRFPAVTAD